MCLPDSLPRSIPPSIPSIQASYSSMPPCLPPRPALAKPAALPRPESKAPMPSIFLTVEIRHRRRTLSRFLLLHESGSKIASPRTRGAHARATGRHVRRPLAGNASAAVAMAATIRLAMVCNSSSLASPSNMFDMFRRSCRFQASLPTRRREHACQTGGCAAFRRRVDRHTAVLRVMNGAEDTDMTPAWMPNALMHATCEETIVCHHGAVILGFQFLLLCFLMCG